MRHAHPLKTKEYIDKAYNSVLFKESFGAKLRWLPLYYEDMYCEKEQCSSFFVIKYGKNKHKKRKKEIHVYFNTMM